MRRNNQCVLLSRASGQTYGGDLYFWHDRFKCFVRYEGGKPVKVSDAELRDTLRRRSADRK